MSESGVEGQDGMKMERVRLWEDSSGKEHVDKHMDPLSP